MRHMQEIKEEVLQLAKGFGWSEDGSPPHIVIVVVVTTTRFFHTCVESVTRTRPRTWLASLAPFYADPLNHRRRHRHQRWWWCPWRRGLAKSSSLPPASSSGSSHHVFLNTPRCMAVDDHGGGVW
jgi:hypothetical protein